MKQLEKSGLPFKKVVAIPVLSIALSIVIFLLSKDLMSTGSKIYNEVLVFFAVMAGLSAGTILYLHGKLSSSKRILEILKEKASTDKLTELYNRSYLDPFLESEIDAADKSKQQLSMIMVDMDHFKEINDTYGHVVGDHVLTIFAQIVLKCIRKTDIIARYGGDEFIVVLPCTDTETTLAVAERLRQEVSDTYIPPVDGVSISSISCSVGVSTYPVHCDSKNSLIRTSDLALYKAKHSGRNCTRVYQSDLALS